jgi:glutamate/aspartate transport system permease protein
MNYDWNWRVLLEFAPGTNLPYWKTIAEGTWWTIKTASLSFLVALLIGVPAGTLRTFPRGTLTRILDLFVEFFRNIPLLVQMFLWFFVVPELVPNAWGDAMKSAENSSFYTAIVSLGLFTSARIAEQVKAGIQSLPVGQRNAALALGLGRIGVYRFVLLPQALRLIVPPMTSEMVNVVKNSSVALAIGLVELMARTRAMQEFSFRIFEAFTVATAVYLLINTGIVLAMGAVERTLNKHRGSPRGAAR